MKPTVKMIGTITIFIFLNRAEGSIETVVPLCYTFFFFILMAVLNYRKIWSTKWSGRLNLLPRRFMQNCRDNALKCSPCHLLPHFYAKPDPQATKKVPFFSFWFSLISLQFFVILGSFFFFFQAHSFGVKIFEDW